MESRGIRGISDVAMLAAALLLPATAAADPTEHLAAEVSYELEFRGSHGFTVNLSGDKYGSGLDAEKLLGTDTETRTGVDYGLRRRTRFDGSKVSLKVPGLASFTGHFVLRKRREEKVEKPCKGKPTVIEEGAFVGKFDFHGELGFTEASATRAIGTVTQTAAQTCNEEFFAGPARAVAPLAGGTQHAMEERERYVQLMAERPDPALPLRLEARFSESPSLGPVFTGTTMSVTDYARAHGIVSSHEVSIGPAPESTLQVPAAGRSQPAEVTLAPPAPFTGSATFERLAGGKSSWAGDLAVELPGIGPVQLTGPEFKTSLCENDACPD